jgi:cell division protein FtsB
MVQTISLSKGQQSSITHRPQSATTVVGNGLQIAALAKQVKELKETVNSLISQIQMLRSDVTKKLSELS